MDNASKIDTTLFSTGVDVNEMKIEKQSIEIYYDAI